MGRVVIACFVPKPGLHALASAHQNAVVRAMWDEYEAVCTYVPVGELPEAAGLFSEFTALPERVP